MSWINSKDKLPKENKRVLIKINNHVSIASLDRFDPNYLNQLTWYYDGAPWRGGNWGPKVDSDTNVLWQPLPK